MMKGALKDSIKFIDTNLNLEYSEKGFEYENCLSFLTHPKNDIYFLILVSFT